AGSSSRVLSSIQASTSRKAFVKTPGVVDVAIGPQISSQGREPDEMMREVEAWIEDKTRELDPAAYKA
ncbi:MAG: hypothetical protein ACKO1L_05630, partial [Brachymonas sp.]